MESSDSAPPAEAPPTAVTQTRRKGGGADTTRFLFLLFVFAVILRTFVVAPFVIPSGSMLPRLMIGDYLFVAKWPYGFSRHSMPFGSPLRGAILAGEPKRGDVVVFRYPGGEGAIMQTADTACRRQTVQMRGGQLFLNGRPVPRCASPGWLMPVTRTAPAASRAGSDRRSGGGRRPGLPLSPLPRDPARRPIYEVARPV